LSIFDERAHRLASPAISSDAEGTALGEGASAATADGTVAVNRPVEHANQSRALAWEVAQTVLLTIAIFLSVRLLVQNFRVEGASMDTTLRSGEFLLINKVTYLRLDGTPFNLFASSRNDPTNLHYVFGGPERGDIVVFRSPGDPNKDFIKRVIGLPGERVKIVDGNVFINGTRLPEPYIVYHATYNFSEKTVPSDSFFVLGDNRPNSSDSHLGWFADADSVIGRAWISYWPPELWSVIPPVSYSSPNQPRS
jgi:signal peptidase I